jgi:hypothetical protein
VCIFSIEYRAGRFSKEISLLTEENGKRRSAPGKKRRRGKNVRVQPLRNELTPVVLERDLPSLRVRSVRDSPGFGLSILPELLGGMHVKLSIRVGSPSKCESKLSELVSCKVLRREKGNAV